MNRLVIKKKKKLKKHFYFAKLNIIYFFIIKRDLIKLLANFNLKSSTCQVQACMLKKQMCEINHLNLLFKTWVHRTIVSRYFNEYYFFKNKALLINIIKSIISKIILKCLK